VAAGWQRCLCGIRAKDHDGPWLKGAEGSPGNSKRLVNQRRVLTGTKMAALNPFAGGISSRESVLRNLSCWSSFQDHAGANSGIKYFRATGYGAITTTGAKGNGRRGDWAGVFRFSMMRCILPMPKLGRDGDRTAWVASMI